MRNRLSLAAAAFAAALCFQHGTAQAAESPDPWITTKVKMALLTTENVPATRINVDTTDGRVTLHGKVATDAEKAKAAQVAREVSGVKDVRNLIQVVADSRKDAVQMSDDQIKREVETVLQRDKALADSKITVKSVNQGVVVLYGSAKTLSDHRRALEDARSVQGVRRVASEIQSPDTLADEEIWHEGKYDPQVAERSTARDAWITTDAKLRLIANPDTPARDINVDTNGSVVTLFGTVSTQKAREMAEAEVKKIDGVKAVENAIQVVPAAEQKAVAMKDDQIQQSIEKRLDRDDLNDATIDVDVQNGVAHLTGKVASQGDRITALQVAQNTDGVRSVVAELKVEHN